MLGSLLSSFKPKIIEMSWMNFRFGFCIFQNPTMFAQFSNMTLTSKCAESGDAVE